MTAPRYTAVGDATRRIVLANSHDREGLPYSEEVCLVRGDHSIARADFIAAALNAYNQPKPQEQEQPK